MAIILKVADFVEGDTAAKFQANCKNPDGSAFDLTGATAVKLKFRISGGSLQTKTMSVILPATNGQADYEFEAGELTVGSMQGEVEVTSAGGIITSQGIFEAKIRAKL